MTNSQRLAELRKKRKEEEKKSSSTSTSENKTYKNSDRLKKLRLERSIDFDTFEADLNSMGTTVQGIYDTWQTQDTMSKTKTTVEAMQARINAYQDYQKMFGGADLSELANSYKSVLDNWDNVSTMYSQYKDADSFNIAKKNAMFDEQFKGLTYGDVQSKLKEYATDSDEYKYLSGYTNYSDLNDFDEALKNATGDYKSKLQKIRNQYALDNKFDLYKGYTEAEDFGEKSQYWDGHSWATDNFTSARSAAAKDHVIVSANRGETYYVYSDPLYEYVNNKNDARKLLTQGVIKGDYSKLGLEYSNKGYDQLTDEEIAVFNYIDATEGHDKAVEYLEEMSTTLTKRKYDKQTQDWNKAVDSGVLADIGLSVATVPANIVGALGNAFATVDEFIKGEEYNPYHRYRMVGNFATDTRGYISENIAEATEGVELFGQNVPSFLYDTGMSIGDTALGTLTTGKLYSVFAGTNAYQQKAKELVEAGEDESKVFYTALASGAAEMVFEYLSIDKLLKIKNVDSAASLIKNTLKQAGVEGSEELFTEIANIVSDSAIRGKSSELYQMYEDLKSKGYSTKEINTEIAKQVGGQVGWSFTGGALSGGVMGGGASAKSYSEMSSLGKGIKGNERTSDMLDIAGLTPQESEAYKAYTSYANKGINADNISNARLGNLYATTDEGARKTLSSKKSTLEQKRDATETLKKLSVVDEQNTVSKDTINQIDRNIGIREAYMASADELVATGLESGKDTKSYKLATEYKQKLDNGIELTEKEIANLVKANSEAITAEDVATLSEEDAALFKSVYDGKTDKSDFFHSFELVKTLTENNYSADYILEHKGVLSAKQVSAIYKAKVLSSDASLEKAITALKEKHEGTDFIEGTFNDSVINYDNTNVEGKVNWNSLNSNQKKAIAVLGQVGKRAGMDVELISDGLERGINGAFEISGNKMLIDIYAGMDKVDGSKLQDTIIPTTSHEMTHWMKSKSPTLYRKYDNYVFGTLTMSGKSESDILSARRKKMEDAHPGEKFTDAEVRDEVIARASEDMFAKSEEIKKFLNTLTDSEKKSFVEKVKEILQNVKEWLNDFLSKQKSTSDEAKIIRQYADRIDGQIKLWDEMLISSISANQALKKEGITGEELAKSTNKDVKHSHRDVEKGKKRYYNELNSLAMQWANSAGTEQGDYNSLYDSKSHKWCLAVADKNSDGGYRIVTIGNYKEVKELEQIYNAENESFDRYAETYESIKGTSDSGLWESPNREMFGRNSRATNPTQGGTKGNTSTENAEYVRSDNRKTSAEIKRSDRDSLGNTLTEAQQSYFAESKVRDENGNLKVMYHGTPNATFTKFRSGTYFTEHKWYADVYQNQGASSLSYKKTANKPDTYAVYLDIKKPFDTRNKTERDIFYNEYYQQWGTGTDLMESGLPDWLDGQDLQEFLEEKGYDYDGLILDEGATGGYGEEVKSRGISYVVFSPEQVKSVDNKTPTDNPDYRFSMRENVEETKELIAVHNMRVSELEKSLQLGGLPMPSIAIIKAQSGHSEYGDVSLVFNKDTIDPKLSKDNKVYGGDAWTPTYPTIEYKANEKVAEKVRKLYYDFAKEYGYDEARPLYNVAQDLEDELNRHKGEAGLIDYYKDDTRLMNFYLLYSGKGKIEPVMKETRTEMSEVEIEQSKYLINALGEDIINEIKVDNGGSPMSRRKAYFEKNGSKIETAYKQMFSEMYDFSEEQIQNVISQTKQFDYVRMINSAYKYLHNDTVTVKVEEDSSATKEAIRNAASDGYSQWLEDLFKGAEEKSGIRNNVDYFTPMGNRRSFEALHWENNLENVVRVMRSQEETGGGALISGFGIFGVSAKNYKSIAEIKADSERLTHIPEEEYKEIRKGFSARLNEICESIMDKSASNPFIALDNACECVVDAIRISKTKSGILNNLKQYPQLSVTETTVDDIVALVTDIANMPTEYFEAKPRRAVGFNEVATAIIPDSANAELKQKLTDYGIKFVEYEAENEESRLEALNSLEDVKFSDRDTGNSNVFTDIEGKERKLFKHDEFGYRVMGTRKSNSYFASAQEAIDAENENIKSFYAKKLSVKKSYIDRMVKDDDQFLVRLSSNDIRYSDRDSEGNELSKEQQDFFANSKVRDENGNLKVMYHGTYENFTIFDINKTANANIFGKGHYFTSSEQDAQNNYASGDGGDVKTKIDSLAYYYFEEMGYTEEDLYDNDHIEEWNKAYDKAEEFYESGKVMKVYLNITNPVYANDTTELYDKDGNFISARSIEGLKELGFDGIIDYHASEKFDFQHLDEGTAHFVVFDSNQIKLTTNTNPTTNPDIRYSDRDNVSVYDTMGETDRLIKENTQLKEDVERLKERLKLERQITNGNHFNENQLNAVAAHIRNIAKSNYSKPELVNLLKGVYSYIATSKDLNWQDMFAQCYDIASMVLNEARPVTETNEYYKWILNDIRGTKISVNEQQIQNARYKLGNRWRNAFFNKVKITDNAISLDRQWQSWANDYPDLFDAEISDADQLVELYDIYDSVREGSELVVEYDTEEQTRWLAREIYNQYWNVSPIRTTAEKYDKQIKLLNYKHREAMNQLRNNYEDRLKSQHKADRQKAIKLVKEIRERKDKEIAEVKKHSKERMDAYKDNAERKTKIQSITTNALTLNKWLTTNSKDYHIHEALKEPVMKLLQSIDFSSKRMLEKNIPTQKDISFTEAFASVKDMLTKADNMVAGLEELYGHDLAEDIDRLVQATYSLIGDNNYVINKMSIEELKSLDRLVKYIKKVVTDLNKFHTVHHNQGAINLANEFVGYGDKLGKLKKQDGKIGKFLKFRNCTPYYFFKRLGGAGNKLFEAFQDGWDKLAFNVKEIIDFTEKTYTTKEVREWSKETKEFTITQKDGKKRSFKMSIAQIMALHCVSKQEDAMRHLLSKGMTLSRVDKKGNVIAEYENITLTMGDINTIIGTLDNIPKAKEVADKLQEFMNTTCSDWGNAISMARFGIKMFTNPNYFPIKVSPSQIPTDNTKELGAASLFRLLNMSFTKSRNKFADQSIEIGDIFDIFAQHTTDMAKYNALALPVLDFNKFYSYTYADNAGNEYGVENTLRTVFGDESVGYIKRFIRDINGTENVSRDVIGKTFFKNAKLAAVANNLRVILLQPTAYVKASAVIDNKYLLKAKAYVKVEPISLIPKLKKAIGKAEKYCGIIQWKALGYYDTDISKGIAEKVKHADTFWDKAKEKSMMGAEIADKATFGTLWIACEFEIRDTRKDLKVNSEEFYQAVAKRLREIVYSTQVVDSTMTRSDMMRSADGLDKMFTTFGSEPIIAYNMLMDAAVQYNLDKKSFGKNEARKKNGKKIRKTITAYVMVNALAALVESGFDVYRDDEDEEMNIEEFMKLYFKNFALDLSVGNKLPVVKELYSILQGYSSSRMDTQWMEYIYKLAKTDNVEKGIKYSLRLLSDLSGIAFYNAYRDIMATLYKLDILSPEDIEEIFE